MSGDEMIFDPTMSKKKKKKKKPFMLDEEGGGDLQTEETQQSETKEVEPEPAEDKDVEADEEDSRKKDTTDDLDDLNFFNQKKKKKKTKKIFDIDEAEEGVKELKIEGDVPDTVEPEDDLDIMLGNKKKKKKNVKFPDEDEIMEKDEAFEDEDSKKDDGISFSLQSGPAWAGSERDYTYDELLNRVFNIMREKNPDMVAGEKRSHTQHSLKKPCHASFLGGLVLWTPGTSELPLAPSHASVPVFPPQLSAESRKPGYRQAPSGDLAALTMEPQRHWLLNAPEKPSREGPEQVRLGYRRNEAGWS